jgi:hypothetical protein
LSDVSVNCIAGMSEEECDRLEKEEEEQEEEELRQKRRNVLEDLQHNLDEVCR